MASEPKSTVHPKDTWSSLAMKHYGDALLGMRLAQANGVAPTVPPVQVANLRLPPVTELDPERVTRNPMAAPSARQTQAINQFADDEASVVKEARYRMVMAMGGSGAVNAAPAAVSSRKADKITAPREQRQAEAVKQQRDMAEALGEAEGRELVLDVKPTRHKRPDEVEKKPTTKDSLAAGMANKEGRELLLEVKPGAHAPIDENDLGLADALMRMDGKALILDVSPQARKPKLNRDGTPYDPHQPAAEKLGDQLAKLDGKALVLDVRATNKRDAVAEAEAAKRKAKSSAGLFDELQQKDGKELLLDVRAQSDDPQKFERLKERHKLAQKRKRRTGLGSLIPEGWQAEGEVAADDIEEYLDELKVARQEQAAYWGDDPDDGAPLQKSARATHHRSAQVARPTYGDAGVEHTSAPKTEGYGAYEQIQKEEMVADAGVLARPKREAPPAPAPVEATAHAGQGQPQAATAPSAKGGSSPAAQSGAGRPAPGAQAAKPQGQGAAKGPAASSPQAKGGAQQPQRPSSGGQPQRPAAKPAPLAPHPNVPRLSDWDDDDAPPVSQVTGLSGLSGYTGPSAVVGAPKALPSVSAQNPYAPEAVARLCMLSPGAIMRVARTAAVGAGPVLEFVGHLREAQSEQAQTDLIRKFVNEHGSNAQATLEQLLTA